MTKIGQSSEKKLRKLCKPLAMHSYLDVTCTLVKLPGGTYRVLLAFRDWAHGGGLSSHDDFATEDQARSCAARAITLFHLRRLPGRDQWRNVPSPGFRRAIWRVAGRLRRSRGAAPMRNSPC